MTFPDGIAIDKQDMVYLWGDLEGGILIFNTSGTYVRTLRSKQDDSGQFHLPNDILVDNQGSVFVCDRFNKVQV